MYLGAPDRCVRYEIGRLSSRVPNRVMRDPVPPCISPSLVYGNHRIYIRAIAIVWVDLEGTDAKEWVNTVHLLSHVRRTGKYL